MSILLPATAQTYSKDPRRFPMIPDDAVAERTVGAYVVIDGTDWIDLVSGMGAVILGHGRLQVDGAAASQISRGVAFPIPSRLEEEVAAQLVSMLTWEGAESVRFGKNGADVTTSAVRLARAYTGHWDVIYLDYAGHHDWSMTEPPNNGGVPPQRSRRMSRDNPGDIVQALESPHAAVVMEAVPSNHPDKPDPDFFSIIRQACDRTGALLIIDEMVTGFRMAPGGACEYFGIRPDLACYGKGMANGFAVSAVVGPHKIMRRYEEDVFFSLTHGAEQVSLAAALHTMKALEDGWCLDKIGRLGERVLEAAGPYGKGYPQRPVFSFRQASLAEMADHHVLCGGDANLTGAHTGHPVADTIVSAVQAARAYEEAHT